MENFNHYLDAVKKNLETMKAPDYDGKEAELERQLAELEEYERHLKARSISPDSFDKIVEAAVNYAENELSYAELEGVYKLLTK